MQVFRPPPPPPPKIEEPPPPPPPEEVKLPDPEPVADAPDVPDMPGPLGLDADGVAGSDAFGLVGRHGGNDLIGGDGRYRSYANHVKDAVLDYVWQIPRGESSLAGPELKPLGRRRKTLAMP